MSKTFLAFHDGKLLGKRTSKDRDYTHAVVVVDIKGLRRDEWCAPQRDTRENRKSFDYHRSIADGTYRLLTYVNEQDRVRSQLIVSAGYEKFLADKTAKSIEHYERWQAALKTEPYVYGWSMSEANARKMARQAEGRDRKVVAIVPAELLIAKVKQVATAG